MAEDGKRGEFQGSDPADEATQLKKRARRRLIGATALALLAAIVLPMVMDHQPAPPMRDIQVRIPSPDEGVTQRVAPKSAAAAEPAKPALAKEEPAKPITLAKTESEPAKAEAKAEKPDPKAEKAESQPEAKPDAKSEAKAESKPEPKPEAKAEAKPKLPEKPANNEAAAKGGEVWEVQLGAYQEPGRVKLLVGKLKELGIPTYTEKVDTPGGQRTRVRAGPFPSQEAAEKARVRVKIVGVDGPVAKKP